jgi:hypothetical protein
MYVCVYVCMYVCMCVRVRESSKAAIQETKKGQGASLSVSDAQLHSRNRQPHALYPVFHVRGDRVKERKRCQPGLKALQRAQACTKDGKEENIDR